MNETGLLFHLGKCAEKPKSAAKSLQIVSHRASVPDN